MLPCMQYTVHNDIVYKTDTATHKQHIYDDAYTFRVTSLADDMGPGITHRAAFILVVCVVVACLAFHSL